MKGIMSETNDIENIAKTGTDLISSGGSILPFPKTPGLVLLWGCHEIIITNQWVLKTISFLSGGWWDK